MWLNNVLGNDDFLERIINFSKRSNLLSALFFIRHRIRRHLRSIHACEVRCKSHSPWRESAQIDGSLIFDFFYSLKSVFQPFRIGQGTNGR